MEKIDDLLETFLTVIAFLYLWFILTNSNPTLGSVYLFAALISIVLLIINRDIRVTFQKKQGGWFEAIIAGIVGWVLILISSFVVLKLVDPAKATLGSIMTSMNAANPAFSNSVILNWLTVSFAIGYAETQLFARLFEFFADKFKIPINRESRFRFAFIVLVIFLSILFLVYHITAKGVGSTASLLVVAIMMAISLFMVAHFNGETRQAVFTHILSNAVAGFLLLQSGGLLF